MAEKKNHHYVPQCYQRLFSNDGKSIGVYNIRKNISTNKSSIKNTMSRDYFYSKDIQIEDALADIERLCMLVFHKLIENNNYKLHEVERLNVLVYVMTQLGRTVSMSEHLAKNVNEMTLELFKRCSGIEEVDPHLCFRFNEPPLFSLSVFISMIVHNVDLSFKLISIEDQTHSSFITSDNPVCIINPYFDYLGYPGEKTLGYKGVCIMMPLTPKLLIMFYDSSIYKLGTKNSNKISCDTKSVEIINRIIANEAYEILVFNPNFPIQLPLKEFVQKSIHKKTPIKLFNKSQCSLSFFRILDKAKSLNLLNCYQEDLFREYTNYLIKNPNVKDYLERLGGSASEEDREKFYKLLKQRK